MKLAGLYRKRPMTRNEELQHMPHLARNIYVPLNCTRQEMRRTELKLYSFQRHTNK